MAQAAEKFQSAAQIDPSVHYLITASEFSAKAEDLETAENLAQRALNRVEDEREPSQIDLKRSSALTQLANIKLLRRAEDDSTIEALYREVLENDRAAGLEETIHHSAHLNNLALFLRLLGDNAAAGDLFIEAKAISEKLGATDYRSYASLIANHATNLFQWGRHLEARLNIDKALKLDEKNQRLGELGHAIRLTTRALFFAENVSAFNCNRAKKDARSALDLLKGLPQKTSHKAIVVNNLGEVLRECGDYKGARPYLEEAVELSEDAYKTDPNPFIFRKDLLILDALEGEVDDFEETMQHYIGYLTLRLSKDHYQVNKAVRQRDAILDGGIK